MRRRVKVGLVVLSVVIVLPSLAIVAFFVGMTRFNPLPVADRELHLANRGSLIIDGKRSSRSEHGFSQRVGYRPPGSAEVEWFGEVSDGNEPQVHQTGPLLVVIDLPGAVLYVRAADGKWKSLALIFPNDLGPSFPFSFYADKNGLTMEDISRINELGGKRDLKYPTAYIRSFDPATRDLKCSYHVDNVSSWPLHLRLSEDGTRLALIGIGGVQ